MLTIKTRNDKLYLANLLDCVIASVHTRALTSFVHLDFEILRLGNLYGPNDPIRFETDSRVFILSKHSET